MERRFEALKMVGSVPSEFSERSVEALFVSRTVAELQSLRDRTRAEVGEKEDELRRVVGTSYVDLLRTTDAVVAMGEKSERVLAGVKALRRMKHEAPGGRVLDGFVVRASGRGRKALEGGEEGARRREEVKAERRRLHAVGSRVKYLIDTEEDALAMAGEKRFVAAAERVLRAEVVLRVLDEGKEGDRRQLAKWFPVLETTVRPALKGVREKLADLCRAHLGRIAEPSAAAASAAAVSDAAVSGAAAGAERAAPVRDSAEGGVSFASDVAADAASAVAGLALVADLGAVESLRELLRARMALVREELNGTDKAVDEGLGAGEGQKAVVSVVARVAGVVQATVLHAALLFVQDAHAGAEGATSFGAAASAPLGAESLMAFGDLVAPGPEEDRWESAIRDPILGSGRLAAPGMGDVQAQLLAWVDQAKAAVVERLPGYLSRALGSCSAVAAVERGIRAHVEASLASAAGAVPQNCELRASAPVAQQLSSKDAAEVRLEGFAGALWRALTGACLGRYLDVWGEFFGDLFLGRAERILEARLRAVSLDDSDGQVEACVVAAEADLPALRSRLDAHGALHLGGRELKLLWTEDEYLRAGRLTPSAWGLTGRLGGLALDTLMVEPPPLAPVYVPVASAVARVDSALLDTIADAHAYVECRVLDDNAAKSQGGTSAALPPLPAAEIERRRATVGAIVREQTAEALSRISGTLEALLESPAGAKMDDKGATASRGLAIGRLCQALAEHLDAASAAMGDPAAWVDVVSTIHSGPESPTSTLAGPLTVGRRVPRTIQELRQHYWAHAAVDPDAAAEGNAEAGKDKLVAGHLDKLRSVASRGHERWAGFIAELLSGVLLDAVRKDPAHADASAEVPEGGLILVSPYVTEYMFAARVEAYRLSERNLDEGTLSALRGALLDKGLGALCRFVGYPASDSVGALGTLGPRGRAQLILDARALSGMLAGPGGPASAGGKERSLLQALAADEAAIAEADGHVRALRSRTGVLLEGLVLPVKDSDAAPAIGLGNDIGTFMALATPKPVPRFNYLPISMPSAVSRSRSSPGAAVLGRSPSASDPLGLLRPAGLGQAYAQDLPSKKATASAGDDRTFLKGLAGFGSRIGMSLGLDSK